MRRVAEAAALDAAGIGSGAGGAGGDGVESLPHSPLSDRERLKRRRQDEDEDEDDDRFAGDGFDGGFDDDRNDDTPFVSDDEAAERRRDDEHADRDDVESSDDDGGNEDEDESSASSSPAIEPLEELMTTDDAHRKAFGQLTAMILGAKQPVSIGFDADFVKTVDVGAFFPEADARADSSPEMQDILQRFRVASKSCSRAEVEALAELTNEFALLRLLSRSDNQQASTAAEASVLYPLRFPERLPQINCEADLPAVPCCRMTIDGVDVVHCDPVQLIAVRLERDRRDGCLDVPGDADDVELARMACGTADQLDPVRVAELLTPPDAHSQLPSSFRETIGWRMFAVAFGGAILAGAICLRIVLFKDECVVGGATRTVLRIGALRHDDDAKSVLPLVSVYNAAKLSESLFLEQAILPALDALSKGIVVKFCDGTKQLVVGALFSMPADMSDRWTTWQIAKFQAPLAEPVPKSSLTMAVLRPPVVLRNVEECADIVQHCARVTAPPRRLKTRARAVLSAAGLAKGKGVLWTQHGQLVVPFVYIDRPHLRLFRSAIGALRAAPDPLHTFGSGIYRNIEHLIGWTVFHYSASLGARNAAADGDAAIDVLNSALRRLPPWRCNRPGGNFWYKLEAKLPGKKDVRTMPGSSALFGDVFLRLPELMHSLGPLCGLSDHLVAWLRRCGVACLQLAAFESQISQSHDTVVTADELNETYLRAIRSLVDVFNDEIVATAAQNADGFADDSLDQDEAGAGDHDDSGSGSAGAAEDVDQRTLGERLLLLPKVVDALFMVDAARLIAPFHISRSLGAMGEFGHQSVKSWAKRSGRRDAVFVITLLAADIRRWWLRRVGLEDDDDEQSRAKSTADNVLPIVDGAVRLEMLPHVVRLAIAGDDNDSVEALLLDHTPMRLRGLHIDSHRFYTQTAVEGGVAEVAFAPLLLVKAPGVRNRDAPFGVLIDIIALFAHGARGQLTQRSARRCERVFMVLEEFKRNGTCPTCRLTRFCAQHHGKMVVELVAGVQILVLPSNDALHCDPLPTESRNDKIRHWNFHLSKVKAKCRGW